jgi:hypothetical protein
MGCVLIAATCGLILLGLQQAALPALSWKYIPATITIRSGLVCGFLLLLHQWRTATKQQGAKALILPFHVIADPILLAQFLLSFLAGFTCTYITITLPMWLEAVNFLLPSERLIHIGPFAIAFGIGASLCGPPLKDKRLIALRLCSAWLLLFIGDIRLATIVTDYSVDPNMDYYIIIAGLGAGMASASCTFGGKAY